MKKILIPIDYRTFNHQAVDYAIELFKNETCDFYFLSTYNYVSNSLNALEILHAYDDWYDEPKEASMNRLGDLIKKYSVIAEKNNHKFHAISECSDLVSAIKKNVDALSLDVIILSNDRKAKRVVDKTLANILDKIRSCPVLLVSTCTEVCDVMQITIASSFKQKINIDDLESFALPVVHVNFELQVLVLEKAERLSESEKDNLQTFIDSLRVTFNITIKVAYIGSKDQFGRYASSHLNSIMCIIDEKPNLFRKTGLVKSNIITALNNMQGNTVLMLHQ